MEVSPPSEKVLGKGSGEGVLRRVLRRGSSMGFTVKKGSERRVLRRGSEKAVSRRCLERPLVEYAPLGVRPRQPITPLVKGVEVYPP